MELYPLIMAPCFVGGSNTPWGGTMLRDVFLKDTPHEITGASLEVSALEGQESMVAATASTRAKSLTAWPSCGART